MFKQFLFCIINVSLATSAIANCIEDASTCTPKQLCEVSTESIQGKLVWRNDAKLTQHMKLIKDFGLDCGEVASACEATPAKCSISELCTVATLEKNGSLEWNIDALDHLALVKEYGLTCNVATRKEVDQDKLDNSVNDKTFTKADFSKLTSEQRKKIQYGLKKLGLYNSSVDGLWGKNTSVAITSYVQQKYLNIDELTELYKRLDSEGLFTGYDTARSNTSSNNVVRSVKGTVTCNLNDNYLFERNVQAYNYQRNTDIQLNDVRRFTISDDIITMGYSKLSQKDDGTWTRHIRIICEMNDNNWSPCGSFFGKVTIKRKGNAYSGVLNIPYQWSTNGNVPIVDLKYSCSK